MSRSATSTVWERSTGIRSPLLPLDRPGLTTVVGVELINKIAGKSSIQSQFFRIDS